MIPVSPPLSQARSLSDRRCERLINCLRWFILAWFSLAMLAGCIPPHQDGSVKHTSLRAIRCDRHPLYGPCRTKIAVAVPSPPGSPRLVPNTELEQYPIRAGGDFNALAVAPLGDVYISTHWPSTLIRLHVTNNSVKTTIIRLAMDAPGDIAVSADGSIWVADQHWYNGRYAVAHINDGVIETVYTLPESRSSAHVGSLATDRLRRLWYVAPTLGKIGVIDPGLNQIKEYPAQYHSQSLAIDNQDRIWTQPNPTLTMMNTRGRVLRRFTVADAGHIYTPFLSYAHHRVWFAGYDNRNLADVRVGWIDTVSLMVHKCHVPTLGTNQRITSVAAATGFLLIAPWGAPNEIAMVTPSCELRTVSVPGASISLVAANPKTGDVWALDTLSRSLWRMRHAPSAGTFTRNTPLLFMPARHHITGAERKTSNHL